MNRNPLIPFFIIMAFGIVLTFVLSFKGLGDAKEMAKEKKGGEKIQPRTVLPTNVFWLSRPKL
jgi:cytochrome c550